MTAGNLEISNVTRNLRRFRQKTIQGSRDIARISRREQSGMKAEPLTPDEQKHRFAEMCERLGTDEGEAVIKEFGIVAPTETHPADQ